ncbi:uncharacterized protein LOC115710086 [Cannabis sativa]|uniref:PGG domain-containing protein n=3 Tax=Cannabis sativa TaxID=3483 RepID=A0A7J6HIX0_CANSA|nr:uncharacterized protein LOC115710086 [Cannabis sativa]KAF4356463.1 hypothetical protein G4B88_015297 [Cannabis sativa]KAF4395204.1 hypothetical protein F8388_001591 [Cannabis sativa]
MANPPKGNSTAGSWRWFKSFQYDKEHDKPADARNVLLVVAALITAVTFQAGVNPPGGVWQDSESGHTAGRSIYATHKIPFYVFLISNTLALSSSILVIICLTYRFPFHFEVWLATISMLVTYGSAVFAVTPNESVKFRYILFAAAVPVLIRFLWEAINRWGRKFLGLFR